MNNIFQRLQIYSGKGGVTGRLCGLTKLDFWSDSFNNLASFCILHSFYGLAQNSFPSQSPPSQGWVGSENLHVKDRNTQHTWK